MRKYFITNAIILATACILFTLSIIYDASELATTWFAIAIVTYGIRYTAWWKEVFYLQTISFEKSDRFSSMKFLIVMCVITGLNILFIIGDHGNTHWHITSTMLHVFTLYRATIEYMHQRYKSPEILDKWLI